MEPVSLPRLSLAERDRRYALVRAAMAENGLDCILAPENTGEWDACQPDIRYLTTIGGGGTAAAAIFPARGIPCNRSGAARVEFCARNQGWVLHIRRPPRAAGGDGTRDRRRGERQEPVPIGRGSKVCCVSDGTNVARAAALEAHFRSRFVDASRSCTNTGQVKARGIRPDRAAQRSARMTRIRKRVRKRQGRGHRARALRGDDGGPHPNGGEVPAMLLIGIGKAPSQTFLMPTFRALGEATF